MRSSVSRLAAFLAFLWIAQVASGQSAIFVVRHAEKASSESGRDVALSREGRARAERLAAMLKDAGVTQIYSTDTVRTRSTAEPLARLRNLEVRLYASESRGGRSGSSALAETLGSNPTAVVLVVGHSNTVPDLLRALGVRETIEIADGEYDDLFVVIPARPSGDPTFLRLRY